MADPTLEEVAKLFRLGPEEPDKPPRFAKVTAVSGDTATVSIGSGTADAVRCCDCAAGDVVLVVTMPSGLLAAVAVKGYSGGGGGGGVQTLTIGTVSGATFTDSGTATDPVLDLTVPTYVTCTESSWGDSYDTAYTWSNPGYGGREFKFSDGRLVREVWEWYTISGANMGEKTTSMSGRVTAFSDTPTVVTSSKVKTNVAVTAAVKSWSDTSCSFYCYAHGTTTGSPKALILIRMFGHWN